MLDFTTSFEQLTGNKPFPWQARLYDRFIAGEYPQAIDLPTGLGKTSVIAIWLLALANAPDKTPRRLVYVVNRRTIVDQTTTEVERYRERLLQSANLPALLGQLVISTLRGQFADNREWSKDPSRPAVIVGTVDMIGSRLLFSGYGIGYKLRPLHAGFLGQQVLLIHDEAHLEPAFQHLLVAIEQEQTRGRFPSSRINGSSRNGTAIEQEQTQGRFPDCFPMKVIELSATSRSDEPPFRLDAADKKHAIVRQRLNAHKQISLRPIDSKEKDLVKEIVTLAKGFENSGRAIVIFVRTVEHVQKIAEKLPTATTRRLTGTIRGHERDALVDDAIFKRFLPDAIPTAETVYLVCTSAGEVGVNISADDLICDLSTYDSMAQRFGRVNRFGKRDDSTITIVHPEELDLQKPWDQCRARTLELLIQLNGNASPEALSQLDRADCIHAFAPTPEILSTSDILFDAWAMTTITEKLPGRPPVAEYLHGVEADGPTEVQIAWRDDVNLLSEADLADDDRATLLEVYPLKPREILKDQLRRAREHLDQLAARHPDAPAWVVSSSESVQAVSMRELAQKDARKNYAMELGYCTVILSPLVGGLSQGMLDGTAESTADIAYDVADDTTPDAVERRFRVTSGSEDLPTENTRDMRLVWRCLVNRINDEDHSAATAANVAAIPAERRFYVARRVVNDAASAAATMRQTLKGHTTDVARELDRMIHALSLDNTMTWALRYAAEFHDVGKDRAVWQRRLGNLDYPNVILAKSNKLGRLGRGSTYRHEFGSLTEAPQLLAIEEASPEIAELAQHLIAAHHGRGRPHFPQDETLDPQSDEATTAAVALETARRFACLQRKYGRWGLAYLESLLRAADYAASADPKEGLLP